MAALNDRGKPVSPVDVLKASLLTPVEDDEQRAANQAWKKTVQGLISWGTEPDTERDSTFVKSWLRAKYAQTKGNGNSSAPSPTDGPRTTPPPSWQA